MRALGFDLPKDEVVAILKQYGVLDPKEAGAPGARNIDLQSIHPTRIRLPLTQFQTIMARRIHERDPRDEILRAFQLFDQGGKGKIDIEDLRRVASELGEGLGDEELTAMIEEFDLDGDGAINEDEFLGICLQR